MCVCFHLCLHCLSAHQKHCITVLNVIISSQHVSSLRHLLHSPLRIFCPHAEMKEKTSSSPNAAMFEKTESKIVMLLPDLFTTCCFFGSAAANSGQAAVTEQLQTFCALKMKKIPGVPLFALIKTQKMNLCSS